VSKVKFAIALITLSVATVAWAVPEGIAHRRLQPSVESVSAIRLREGHEGLLANAWINGAGPFTFAIDTGAGVSLISRNAVDRARLQVNKSRRTLVGGLSTAPIASNQETRLSTLALGTPNNRISTHAVAAVVSTLPGAIDGILDPTDVFSPLGYSVDLPHHELRVFEGRLHANDNPPGGAVVHWIGNDRPFVRLSNGDLALIDTGSGCGLAVTSARVVTVGARNNGEPENRNDLGGGRVQSREISPQRVSIGALVLNGVPTDVLTGAAPGTPTILGRKALFPFRITFDPVARLISFEPAER
jgi:predicted aspartyl protease